MDFFMKEPSTPLLERAKRLAAERKISLRELVRQSLEDALAEKRLTARERAKNLFAEMDKLPEFSAGDRLSRSDAHAR
jgi:hypothetical protein